MTLLGGVQRRDLPGQIVIPRPGGELVDAHRHNPLKPFHVVAAVRSAAKKPEMQRGVWHSGS